jgi:putative addiction module component (TIGR02574 family)
VTSQTQAVLDAALALPEAERALLVEHLLGSWSEEGDELTHDELMAELDRRRAEITEGKVKPIAASQLWLEE